MYRQTYKNFKKGRSLLIIQTQQDSIDFKARALGIVHTSFTLSLLTRTSNNTDSINYSAWAKINYTNKTEELGRRETE